MGPFIMHPITARVLGVPENKLRLIVPPDIGGSFGIKSSLYPYMTLIALAARLTGVPVKWIEDRREHLMASSSGTDRVAYRELAARKDGTVLGMRFRWLDNVGGYLRSPEPGCSFRPSGNFVGPYRFQHLEVDASVVMTNKSLTGPNRGYACGHLYFETEGMMDRLAAALQLDPVEVRRRNLIPAGAFPYRTPTGGIYDSGDYPAVLDKAVALSRYEELRREQAAARAAGRWFGIGVALAVDPSVSNMGYVATALDPQLRAKPEYLPKSGAIDAATIRVDPLGRVIAILATTPQGQGHQTVVSQIVATELGCRPEDVTVVDEMDTFTRFWSISSGSYSSRFGAVATSAVALAARKLKAKLVAYGAHLMERPADELEFRDGAVRPKAGKGPSYTVKDLAGRAHWNTESLPEGMEPGLEARAVFGFTGSQIRGPGRLHQLVEHLWLHRRGDGGGGRSRDGGHQDPALRLRARRGHHHQSDDRARADLRRRAPRPRRRAVRGAAVRRRRAVPDRLVHGLPRADRRRGAGDRHRASRIAVAAHAARLERARRGELDDRARGDRQCRERCAGPARHPDHRAADDAHAALGADRARPGVGLRATVKPPRFEYHAPGDVDEALALLGRYGGEAKLLAGGQSLMPLLNFRLSRPAALVDLNGIRSLAYIEEDAGHVRLGAMTRQRAIEFSPVVRRRLPLLAEATALVGHLPIRTRGTIGGSLAHADPSAEYPAILAALDGAVVVRGPRGERVLTSAELFRSYLATSLGADEILVEVRLPAMPAGAGFAFEEFSRRHGDFAIVGIACVLIGEGGRCTAARLATAGTGPVPTRLVPAEEILERDGLSDAAIDAAAAPGRCARHARRRPARLIGLSPPPDPRAHRPRAPPGRRANGGVSVSEPTPIRLTVNGQAREGRCEPRKLLVDFLREDLGLTGTHVGCEHGVCGACTVLVDGEAARSCLMLAVQANGAEVLTVEGLMVDGALHPLQQAFHEHHALQCGFCTPGMLLTALDLLRVNPRPTEDEIRQGLSAVLCRCTGYQGIVDAVAAVARGAAS